VWGLAIALFGLSSLSLGLGLALLVVAGAADAISAICRGTLLQTLTPDRLRGRLSATNSMVVVGGPYLGDFRAGWVARLTSTQFSLLSGGLACVGLSGVILLLFPEMNRELERLPTGVALADSVPVGDGGLS
jgi:MFS family permease